MEGFVSFKLAVDAQKEQAAAGDDELQDPKPVSENLNEVPDDRVGFFPSVAEDGHRQQRIKYIHDDEQHKYREKPCSVLIHIPALLLINLPSKSSPSAEERVSAQNRRRPQSPVMDNSFVGAVQAFLPSDDDDLLHSSLQSRFQFKELFPKVEITAFFEDDPVSGALMEGTVFHKMSKFNSLHV